MCVFVYVVYVFLNTYRKLNIVLYSYTKLYRTI